MKREFNFKKGLSVFLAVMLVGTFFPMFMNDSYNVKAGTGNSLSVTAYATKEELMTAFAPNVEGSATNIGRLAFGNKSNGDDITWYILGRDNSVSGDNIAIFATAPIATGIDFNDTTANLAYSYAPDTGYGATSGDIMVYSGHYGASGLRAYLYQVSRNSDFLPLLNRA